MADTKQQAAPAATPGFFDTVLADIKQFFGKTVSSEVDAGLKAVWTGVKAVFTAVTADQVKILNGLIDEAVKEAKQGQTWEGIITDVMNKGEEKELTWLRQIPSEVILALAALRKHAASPALQTPSTVKK